MHHRHYNTVTKRAALSAVLIALIAGTGTLGMHHIEGMSWLDAFYFTSMIATAQGAAITPSTAGGKIFAALLSYVSVGAGVAALGFVFGPFMGRLWRMGVVKIEEEIEKAENRKSSGRR